LTRAGDGAGSSGHGRDAVRPHCRRPPVAPIRDRAQREIELVGQARTGREVIATALETQPDLAALDVEMPDLCGLEMLRALGRTCNPR
jgi:DNA-binding NarL/FixJ family response regulator